MVYVSVAPDHMAIKKQIAGKRKCFLHRLVMVDSSDFSVLTRIRDNITNYDTNEPERTKRTIVKENVYIRYNIRPDNGSNIKKSN